MNACRLSALALILGAPPLVFGCGDTAAEPEPIAASLIDPRAFSVLSESEDPFDDRPETVSCPPTSRRIEPVDDGEAIEIRTDDCKYVSLGQPSLVEVLPGDEVVAELFHFELASADNKSVHTALMLDGELIFDEQTAVPSGSGGLSFRWTAERPIERGAPLVFHLHNHGLNAWVLTRVERVPR